MNSLREDLERAWSFREDRALLSELGSLRVFHGPGEGRGELESVSIDLFTEVREGESSRHFWITEWERRESAPLSQQVRGELEGFLKSKGALTAVILLRPEKGVPREPTLFLGQSGADFAANRLMANEGGVKFWIRLLGVKHPGLFLDHYPLRCWLRSRTRGLSVLNTFSYTGSLSVACGLGDAAHVTTLDLSGSTLKWAEENWRLNALAWDRARFIAGDYFEWLPRLKREGKRFDAVILDPPSFSRGKKGNFSTAKDLKKLHLSAFEVLAKEGILVTSINSANISRSFFAEELLEAAREAGVRLQVLSELGLPETHPTRFKLESGARASSLGNDRYLKGWILRISSGK